MEDESKNETAAESEAAPAGPIPEIKESERLRAAAGDLAMVWWVLLLGGIVMLAYGAGSGSAGAMLIGGGALSGGLTLCVVGQLLHIRAGLAELREKGD